jgi:hypothetical protein
MLFILLVIAGLGDCVSTSYGLSKGFVETRSYYFPFLSTIILSVAVTLILYLSDELKQGYRGFAFGIVGFLIVLSFTGLANNLWVFMT